MLTRYLPFIARVLLAATFLPSGIGRIFGFAQTAAGMRREGMLTATEFLLAGAIAFEISGALLILIGYKTRFGALLLVAFLIPVTLIFQDFWQ